MKTKLIIAILAIMTAWCATPAWAQLAKVRGKVTDENHKPIAGALVEFINKDTGHKYPPLKTDKEGEFVSIAILPGVYTVNLKTAEGAMLDAMNNFQVRGGQTENVANFDLAASRAAAQAAMKPEERARIEEAKQANIKIGNLNAMLKSAREALAAGNPEEAVRIMTEATTADGTRDILWAQLADSYLALAKKTKDRQQYEDAVAAYQKAVERVTEKTPKNVVALYHNGLGQCYTRLGKLDEAIKSYQAAVDNDPANAAMFDFNMGAAYLGAGKKDEATAAFTRAIQADPNYAEAYYQRAINLSADIKVDEKTGAMIVPPQVTTDLNKYLELKPEGPNAEGAKALLASFGTKVETSYGPQRKTAAPKKK